MKNEYLDFTFFNRGDYEIKIEEVQIMVIENEVVTPLKDNLLPKGKNLKDKSIIIRRHDKKHVYINYNTMYELGKEFEKFKNVYLCFDVVSASGENFIWLAYKLWTNKTHKFIYKKTNLKRKMDFIEE